MLALLLPLLLAAGVTADLQSLDLVGRPVTIEADRIVFDAENSRVLLLGNAVLRVDETIFRADRIVVNYADPDHPSAIATGDVVFDDPVRGRVTGERLQYDFEGAVGEATDLQLTIPLTFHPPLEDLMRPEEVPDSVFIEAERAAREGDLWYLDNASVTTSPADPPQYSVGVESLVVTTGGSGVLGVADRLQARGVSFSLGNTRLIRLPALDIGEGGLLLPTGGSNSTDGYYIEHRFAPLAFDSFRWTITPRLGTDNFFSGTTRVAAGTGLGVFEAIGSYKQHYLPLVTPGARQLSKMPELGWRYPVYDLPILGGDLRAHASYGQYDEEGNLSSWRHEYDLNWQRPAFRTETSRGYIGGAAQYAFYDTGQEYGWLRGDIGVEKRFGYLFYLGVDVSSHWITGQTPFIFDRVEVATQLNSHARLRLGDHWLLGNRLMFDFNQSTFRREEYSLTYRDRLLEYGVRMLTRPDLEFKVDAKILGF